MAGTQNIGEPSDNPVAINVTAIVDIVFCLCLFFMTSIHFKELEGKIETWMPKEGGRPGPATLHDQIRVTLKWNPEAGRTLAKVGSREVRSDDEMAVLLRRYPKSPDLSVALDAGADVPWRDAVRVVDLCRRTGFDRVEFTEPFR